MRSQLCNFLGILKYWSFKYLLQLPVACKIKPNLLIITPADESSFHLPSSIFKVHCPLPAPIAFTLLFGHQSIPPPQTPSPHICTPEFLLCPFNATSLLGMSRLTLNFSPFKTTRHQLEQCFWRYELSEFTWVLCNSGGSEVALLTQLSRFLEGSLGICIVNPQVTIMLNTMRDPTSVDSKFQEDMLSPTPSAWHRGWSTENPKY